MTVSGSESGVDPINEIDQSRAPLMAHLEELRRRLIVSVGAVFVATIIAMAFSTPLLQFMIAPFAQAANHAGHGDIAKLQTTGALESFITRLKLSFFLGFCFAFPIVAREIYLFIAPGLYRKERKTLLPYLLLSPVLFAMGAALVYYFIMPAVLKLSFSQEVHGAASINFIPKLSEYYSLITALIFAFGLAFQLPLVLTFMGQLGIISAKTLRQGRKIGITVVFVIAAIVTPPDPLSQLALAIPMCLLYEIGVLAVAIIEKRRARQQKLAETPVHSFGSSPP